MKVYYVGGSYDSCYYVRCMHPLVYNGWDGHKRSLRTSKVTNEQMFKDAIKADVIVFHRPIDRKQLEAAKLLKIYGKKVVMDNDDTYIPDSGVPTQMFGAMSDKLKRAVASIDGILKEFASISDMVTVSTDFLKQEYQNYNENVVTLPNCVDPLDWNKPKKNDTDEIRVGIVGSVASNKDYKQIIPLLEAYKARGNVKIVLFALPPKTKGTEWAVKIFKPEFEFWNQYNVEWQPFVQIQDYMDTLNNLKLDLMLIPRHDNYFNRAKSNIKFLEASMCEVPVIAQGFSDGLSPYQVDSQDAEHMVICNSEDDWVREGLSLLDDTERRIQLGKKAREYVINKYNIKTNAHKWRDAYQTLWTKTK